MGRSVIATLPPTLARQRDELIDRAREATTPCDMFSEASTRLRRIVPFDAALWLATDPATGLPALPTLLENVTEDGGERCLAFWEREFLVEDVNLFRDLWRSETPAAALRARTDDRPARSARYREFLRPMGMGDELRGVLRTGQSRWGEICLLREKGRPSFTEQETAIVATLSTPLGEALRARARLIEAPSTGGPDGPGVMTVNASGTITSITDEARAWIDELPRYWRREAIERHPPSWVIATVAHARAIGQQRDHGTARVRLRTRTGRWLVCHASCLRDADGAIEATALVIEPAQAAEVLPIVVEAYELSRREKEVAQLLARGASTLEIARQLFISTHTVRDYVKAIFAKLGVSSRGELVAKLFAEHYGPLHMAESNVLVVEREAA